MDVIIGAGISGLSYAAFLPHKNYLILEAAPSPGGYCKTTFKDGFVWDYSGHFFHFQDEEIKRFVTSPMDKKNLLNVKRRAQIYYKNNYIDFPFQKNIHQLAKEEFIDCLYGLYFRGKKSPGNFKEMLNLRYGDAICKKFLYPYNEKIYKDSLALLDVNAMGRFFPHADMEEIVRNFKIKDDYTYNSFFLYPSGGAFEYIKSILTRVLHDRIFLNEKAVEVNLKNKTLRTSLRTIQYDNLISTVPFFQLLTMLKIDFNESLYNYSKVLVLNMGFDKKGSSRNHWVYFPDREYCFYRVGYYDNILNADRMSLYVELSFMRKEKIDIVKMREYVLSELKKTEIIKDQKLISWQALIMDPAYVYIEAQSQKDVKEKREYLSKKNIYTLGRYGRWKYCSIEDNIKDAGELAMRLNSV
ncbi:MAG: NAD(P)-binding protein [Thermodesulfobacteriota bacterium]|nr:NAD(P)-binding protein [Thermodesulfobacteriota bacterium]